MLVKMAEGRCDLGRFLVRREEVVDDIFYEDSLALFYRCEMLGYGYLWYFPLFTTFLAGLVYQMSSDRMAPRNKRKKGPLL